MAKYDKNGYITELDENEVFVFGSNGQGAHLGGAAATAVQKFGAKMGQAEGLQGQSYAINTMDSEDEMLKPPQQALYGVHRPARYVRQAPAHRR